MPKDHDGPRRIEINAPGDEQASADECPFPGDAGAEPIDISRIEGELLEAEQSADDELGRLQAMIEEMEQRCSVAEEEKQRVAAEMHNYKRRVQQEKQLLTRYATEGIVAELIPVLDNFERAMEVPVESSDGECLMAGVQMIYGQLQSMLEGHGVKQISAMGQTFDPNLHEAVERLESEEHLPGTIVAELAKGYSLQDRLLRPARVRVTVSPEE